MSTIRVNAIQNTNTTDGGISIDNSGHVTLDGQAMPSAGPLSNRNLIINGAMQVAQRGTSQTGITSSTYAAVDRFRTIVGGSLGTWTAAQDTNAPNGFSNSFKLTCTSGVASPASNGLVQVRYYVEAQDLQSLAFGTSDAKSITMSFWVRSNKTGNASFTIEQRDNSSKHVSYQYSISSADTWEYKTITISGDTAGVINNDNGQGFQINWSINSGTTYSSGSHSSTWTTFSNSNFNPSNLGVGGATDDYFAITGVQLEVGSVATPFEHRSYGDELARCQRYYQKVSASSSAPYARLLPFGHMASSTVLRCVVPLNPPMRTLPTFNQSGTFATQPSVGTPGLSLETNSSPGGESVLLIDNSSISGTAGNCISIHANNDDDAYIEFSAEL